MSEPERLLCPVCQTPVPAANINIAKFVAVCPNCSHMFTFQPQTNTPTVPRPAPALTEVKWRKVQKPDALIELADNDERLALRYPWRPYHQPEQTGFLLIALMFAVGAVAVAHIALSLQIAAYTTASGLGTLAMVGAILAPGLFFALSLIKVRYNQSTLLVEAGWLRRKSGPIPANDYELSMADIEAVFLVPAVPYDRGGRFLRVKARLFSGEVRTLVDGVAREAAFYIVQKLHERQGILPPDEAGIDAETPAETEADDTAPGRLTR